MTTLPEEAVKAASEVICAHDNAQWGDSGTPDMYYDLVGKMLTAALPFLSVQGVKVKALEWGKSSVSEQDKAQTVVGSYFISNHTVDAHNLMFDNDQITALLSVHTSLEAAKAAAQADYEARILSALEPSAPDMGNPITDKTVKMVLAEAIAQVWYQTSDCDVEEIDRIISHLNRNGLLIVGSQRFRMMADAIQSASAYLALSQPNSAENLIAELDTALNGETARVNQLFGNSEPLIESLIKDADWLGEYGHQMHEEDEYHDGGYTANRLQAIGDRISKLIETVVPVSAPSTGRADVLEEALRKMVALYESEYDADVPFKRPDWLVAVLSSPDHADAGKVEGGGWLPMTHPSLPKKGRFLAVATGEIERIAWNDPAAVVTVKAFDGPFVCYVHEDGAGFTDEFGEVYTADGVVIDAEDLTAADNVLRLTYWQQMPGLPSAPASEGAE
ncbi:hypothetical protein [Brucella anthropi]|uniref:hypothetical protein n=1 Tax=Brucella anthropi TaxID=529 RepID=UPI000697B34F|nr:hypothetical protein [Brucella anthropi]